MPVIFFFEYIFNVRLRNVIFVGLSSLCVFSKDGAMESADLTIFIHFTTVCLMVFVSYIYIRYIKEGSTVSVMGVVRRHENVLMIVPPAEPVSTGCQWIRCLLPTYVEGLILTCDENQNADVVPV